MRETLRRQAGQRVSTQKEKEVLNYIVKLFWLHAERSFYTLNNSCWKVQACFTFQIKKFSGFVLDKFLSDKQILILSVNNTSASSTS